MDQDLRRCVLERDPGGPADIQFTRGGPRVRCQERVTAMNVLRGNTPHVNGHTVGRSDGPDR